MTKLTVLETFEQGLDRKDGGVIKLIADGDYKAKQAADGSLQVTLGDKVRTIPAEIVTRLVKAKLVKIDG